MTYLSLTKARWIKAVAIVGGPTNVFREEKLRPEMKKLGKEMFGGSIKEKRKRSAIFLTHLFPRKTPLLIMHGTADWRVSPLDSIEIAKKLYENKVPHRLVLFEGADHSLTENKEESTDLTLRWFERFLKKSESIPDVKPHGH